MNKLIAISLLVFGFGVGGWWYHAGSTPFPACVAHAELPTLTARGAGLSPGRADIDPSVLRTLIREEMTAAMGAKAGSSPAATAPVKDAVSPETLARRREALQQIDVMLAQGVWCNEQRFTFHQKVAVLDPGQREHAMRQFATAFNSGALKVSTDGPPL